ncbi:MAG: hypothetical protein IKE91_03695 [Clostridia bacterium]|nr:hypothetical protein [Clostridia bacterium]
MKDKILVFIIGVLVGAIVATSVFFVYEKKNSSSSNDSNQGVQMRDGETPPDMPNGERPNMQDGETPPEKPEGENNNGGNPPERPTNNKTNNNS